MRNLGFRHSRKWASPVCHQIIRLRCFTIMKRGHSATLPFHPFSIHFSFSYLFFDRMFPNYPWPLDGLILRFSHERELPTHPIPGAAGPEANLVRRHGQPGAASRRLRPDHPQPTWRAPRPTRIVVSFLAHRAGAHRWSWSWPAHPAECRQPCPPSLTPSPTPTPAAA